jgi:hypothetical protein
MSAGVYHFTIEQGAAFGRVFDWVDDTDQPIDLTGCTAAMQLRDSYPSPIARTWTPYLTVEGPVGRVTLAVPAADTAAITLARGVYDLELTPPAGSGATFRFLQGRWDLAPEVTK